MGPLSLTITGPNKSSKVDDTLTAIVTGADVVTYSWTADGTEVGTEEDLDITADMLGKKIQVKVTALDGETVKSEESDPVEYEKPELVTAVRKAANSFTATFDADAQDIVKVDDIEVISEDLTDVKKITGLDFSLDGLTAVVTVSTSFKDGVTYNVNYGDSTASFVASVGEVDKIEIATSQAEVNTPTKIEFALFDANGVDVTSAVKIDETCTVTFEGDYDNYNNKKASDTTVTMATSGSICTVTVEYDKNDGVTDQVTASRDITCVAASEKIGTPFFKAATAFTDPEINNTDNCYRFYDDDLDTDDNVVVSLEATLPTKVHFYAADADGSAIDYDSYEIETADETIATVEMGDQATGKWAEFEVTGNTKGSVELTLKATKNGAETTYNIPVTVKAKAVPVKATMTLSDTTMSNTWDEDYKGTITVKVYAADGTLADPAFYTPKTPVLKTENKGVADELEGDAAYDGAGVLGTTTGFIVDPAGTYSAWAAEGGSYVIEEEVTDLGSGKVLTARNTVTVKELPENAWIRTTDVANATALFFDLDTTAPAYATFSTDYQNTLPALITCDDYDKLPATSTATNKVTNAANLTGDTTKLADAIKEPATAPAAKDKGKFVYYEKDGTTALDPTAANFAADLKNAAIAAIEAGAKMTKKEVIDDDPTATPATYKLGTPVDVDPTTLLTPTPVVSAGEAGKDVYKASVKNTAKYYKDRGVKTSYTIKLGAKTLGYDTAAKTDVMSASLTATMNGLFAGYVHADGTIGAGKVIANNATRIINDTTIDMPLTIQTYFGKNLVAGTNGLTPLYNVGKNGAATKNTAIPNNRDIDGDGKIDALTEKFDTTSGDKTGTYGMPVFYTAQRDQVEHDKDFAREGTYKVEFSYWMASATKATTESAAFSVKNDLYVPTVSVKSQNLDSYTKADWAEAVVSEVDLNNNDESTWSVIDLVDKAGNTIADDKTPAHWAVVQEEGVAFVKPLDRTFKLNS